jgi:hypothetical protein
LAPLIAGLIFIGTSISRDLADLTLGSAWPYVLLGLALLVALGFEFVNGFHDAANAVATVIYTHSLDPNIAVVWSGFWNFAGVVTSSGAVAFGIVSLLPVESILHGLRHGLRATDGCHLMESGYLVVRLAHFQFSHPDWLDHRRGHCQSVDECEVRNQRRGLGPGVGYREVAAALAHLRIYPGLSASFGDESRHQGKAAL